MKDSEKQKNEITVAFAGNPNVGKSTIFNALTGLHQHTGNWTGKTVGTAEGKTKISEQFFELVDLPGTYSLKAVSEEEEVARDYLCFSKPDLTVIVCDATNLARNLNLVLQILEITNNVVVCVNLLDEAAKKRIKVDLDKLSQILGTPVVGCSARNKKSLGKLKKAIVENVYNKSDKENKLVLEQKEYISNLEKSNVSKEVVNDIKANRLTLIAKNIADECVVLEKEKYDAFDRKMDKILTSKIFGYPIMLLSLCAIFWITIKGANYPSQVLSILFEKLGKVLENALLYINTPPLISDILINGAYGVLSWVVAVMLPPMAIFFPLFTLLEDAGVLPRVAFNLDKPFKCCNSCGKQALCMCMGFGCNAVGVSGARIIDSKRERLLAILTNSFVPCNGKFPTIISIITMFFVIGGGTFFGDITGALVLCAIIVLSVLVTFGVTKILSETLLKGEPSSYILELPPYRRPQFLKVLVRSLFDRTLFVLGRAAAVAAPAGVVIWIMANVTIGDLSLLETISDFLNPLASVMGLDGVILLAFILGFPANEIVLPIVIMAYMSKGTLVSADNLEFVKGLLLENGWTLKTAVCMTVFSLFHWPCSTTILTVYKETKSKKWTLLSAVLPTLCGFVLCVVINAVVEFLM